MPTFEDIAKLAGVSKATVSLAFADSAKISSKTKIKIRNIARSIGYINKDVSDAPQFIRNRSIGIVYFSEKPDFEKEFFRDTLLGISEDASKEGYDIVFIGIHAQLEANESDHIVERVVRSGVEGIVVISRRANLKAFSQLLEMRFPMVFVGDRKVEGTDQPLYNVCSDHYNGGKAAAQYLLRLGHRRIAIVSHFHSPHWEADRANGFLSQAKDAAVIEIDNRSLDVEAPFHLTDEAWGTLEQLRPTAVFAINASVGISLIHYLRRAGKRIPDDVSLIIFDDFASFPYENPPVTVIKQDKTALGNLSAKILIDLLENAKVPPRQVQISTQLIERQSCRLLQGDLS